MIKKGSNGQTNVYMHKYGTQNLGSKTLFNTYAKNGANDTIRYFSSVDAEIYFGDVYIDEIVEIQFQLQQNTLPLFGYNSFIFDGVAQGSRIVQGRFAINFTHAGYIYDVLRATSGTGTMPNNPSKKAAMWNKTLDIVVSYGDAAQNNPVLGSSLLTLQNIYITGCSQEFGTNGDSIFEIYTFIAQDMKIDFNHNDKPNVVSSSIANKGKEREAIELTDITYNEIISPEDKKPYGTIVVSYNTLVNITKIGIEPLFANLTNKGLIFIPVDTTVVGTHRKTVYMVPSVLREDIIAYMSYNPNIDKPRVTPGFFDINIVFIYESNGSLRTVSGKDLLDDKFKLESPRCRILNAFINM